MQAQRQARLNLALRFTHQREGPHEKRIAREATYDQDIPWRTEYVDRREAAAEEERKRGQTEGGKEEGKKYDPMSSHPTIHVCARLHAPECIV